MPSHPDLHPRQSSLAGRDASCSNDKVSKGCSKVSAESVAALGQTSVQAVLPWSNGCHRLARMVSIHANAIWSNSIRAELILVHVAALSQSPTGMGVRCLSTDASLSIMLVFASMAYFAANQAFVVC